MKRLWSLLSIRAKNEISRSRNNHFTPKQIFGHNFNVRKGFPSGHSLCIGIEGIFKPPFLGDPVLNSAPLKIYRASQEFSLFTPASMCCYTVHCNITLSFFFLSGVMNPFFLRPFSNSIRISCLLLSRSKKLLQV